MLAVAWATAVSVAREEDPTDAKPQRIAQTNARTTTPTPQPMRISIRLPEPERAVGGSGGGGNFDVSLGETAVAATGLPHASQKRAAATTCAPQFEQNLGGVLIVNSFDCAGTQTVPDVPLLSRRNARPRRYCQRGRDHHPIQTDSGDSAGFMPVSVFVSTRFLDCIIICRCYRVKRMGGVRGVWAGRPRPSTIICAISFSRLAHVSRILRSRVPSNSRVARRGARGVPDSP